MKNSSELHLKRFCLSGKRQQNRPTVQSSDTTLEIIKDVQSDLEEINFSKKS